MTAATEVEDTTAALELRAKAALKALEAEFARVGALPARGELERLVAELVDVIRVMPGELSGALAAVLAKGAGGVAGAEAAAKSVADKVETEVQDEVVDPVKQHVGLLKKAAALPGDLLHRLVADLTELVHGPAGANTQINDALAQDAAAQTSVAASTTSSETAPNTQINAETNSALSASGP